MSPADTPRDTAVTIAWIGFGILVFALTVGAFVTVGWDLMHLFALILVAWVFWLHLDRANLRDLADTTADDTAQTRATVEEIRAWIWAQFGPPDQDGGELQHAPAVEPEQPTTDEIPVSPGPSTVPMHRAWDDSARKLDARVEDVELAHAIAELDDRVWGWRHKAVAS